jgi:serine/threonine protein kinase
MQVEGERIRKIAKNETKLILLHDEIHNLLLLEKENIPGIIRIIESGSDFFVMDKAQFTLRQVLQEHFISDYCFREILFQVLFTLLKCQEKFPDFRHNDLKADNIVLDDSLHFNKTTFQSREFCHVETRTHYETKQATTKSRTWILLRGINTFLIDFEMSTSSQNENGDTLKSSAIGMANDSYGLSSVKCDMFDIHLLFFELRSHSKQRQSDWAAPFLYLCADFFADDCFSPPTCTENMRLSLETQKELLHSRWANHDNFILRVLCHEYFNHLRKT